MERYIFSGRREFTGKRSGVTFVDGIARVDEEATREIAGKGGQMLRVRVYDELTRDLGYRDVTPEEVIAAAAAPPPSPPGKH